MEVRSRDPMATKNNSNSQTVACSASGRYINGLDAGYGDPVSSRTAGFHHPLSDQLMYFTVSDSGIICSVNAYAEVHLGYEQDELLGRPYVDVFHPDDRHAVDLKLGRALETPGQPARWEFRKMRNDGVQLLVQLVVWVASSERGRCIVLIVCEDITERCLEQQQIAIYQRELKDLTNQLALAEERERRRIADGLHSQVAQVLALAKLKLGALTAANASQQVRQGVADVRHYLDQALHTTRLLIFDLSSPVLYELGLEAALQSLGQRLAGRNGLHFRFNGADRKVSLPQDTQVTLYRAAEELLFNVIKHGQARNVSISVRRLASQLYVTVEDDGIGMPVKALPALPGPNGGFGLFRIRERLEHIGGRLDMAGTATTGTRATLVATVEPERN